MARIEPPRGVTSFLSSSTGVIGVSSSIDLINTDKNYHIRAVNSHLILSSSNGSNVFVSGNLTVSGSSGSFDGKVFHRAAAITDIAANDFDIHAGSVLMSASTNIGGGHLHLAAGQGLHKLTIVDYTGLSLVLVQVAVDQTNNIKTEGTHWTAATSNQATATSLGAAIATINDLIVVVSGAVIFVGGKPSVRAISITTSVAATILSGTMNQGINNDGLIKIYQNIEAEHNTMKFYVRNPWSGGNSMPMLTMDRGDENFIVNCWSFQMTNNVGGTSPGFGIRAGDSSKGTGGDIVIFNGGDGGTLSGRNNYVFTDFDHRDTNHLLSASNSATIYAFASGTANLKRYISMHYSGTDGGMIRSNSGSLYLIGSASVILSSSISTIVASSSLAFPSSDKPYHINATNSRLILSSSADGIALSGNLYTSTTSGPGIYDRASTATVPTLIPRMSLTASGIGADTSGVVSIISNARECIRVHNTSANIQVGAINVWGSVNVLDSTGVSNTGLPRLIVLAASNTVPNVVPRSEHPTTGMGSQAVGKISLIAASKEALRVEESGSSVMILGTGSLILSGNTAGQTTISSQQSHLILSSSDGSLITNSGSFRSTGYASASLPNPTTVQSGTITYVSNLGFLVIAWNGAWQRISTGSF